MFSYNQTARNYNELHGEEQLAKLNIIKQQVSANSTVLDVGCGTGLSKLVGNVVGIDPSIELLKQARIPVINAMGEHLPFANDSFDCVVCVTALHNFTNPKGGIQEMIRVSRSQIIISLLKKSPQTKKLAELIRSSIGIEQEIEQQHDLILVGRLF